MANPIPQSVVVVETLVAFQSSNVASYANGGAQIAYLQGTTSELDGGQGFYQRVDNDFSTPSNPPTVVVDAGGNRWVYANVSLTAAAIIALLTGTPLPIVAGGTGQATAGAALDALTIQGANIAAAATTNLATATGEFVVVTGAGGPITALGTATAGIWRYVRFTGAPTLTYNATSLILPGATNITVAAGDTALFMSLGLGNWQCLFYTQISGGSVGTLPVSEGGTGAVTLTNHGVLLGQGTSAIVATAVGATGTVLKGVTGADPAYGAVVLTTDVSGTLPAANGGTGNASYTIGDLLYASGATALSKLADVATGSYLASGGIGVAPAWSAFGANVATWLATPSSANLAAAVTDETGSGQLVFATSPTLVTPVLGAASATSVSFSSTSGVIGTTTNNNAAAGSVGEIIESTVLVGAPVSLTNNTAANVTSISLTAGDWNVWGTACFTAGAGTTIAVLAGWTSSASATFPTFAANPSLIYLGSTFVGNGSSEAIPVSMQRISVAGTTTVYLSVYATFAVGTLGGFGYIGARRAR